MMMDEFILVTALVFLLVLASGNFALMLALSSGRAFDPDDLSDSGTEGGRDAIGKHTWALT
ncbi:MAG: hypothetical protein ACREVE_18035 [Gammaproteobacteria bacterium]